MSKDDFSHLPSFDLTIVSQFQTYFQGDAESVSAVNASGPFDVLEGHANFLSILLPCKIEVRSRQRGDFSIQVEKGVMHSAEDKVTVFLEV